jgi:drug/metabolite transporter (DMT)-like permease
MTSHQDEPKRIWIIAAFGALYFGWGSTFLGILFAVQSIPPFLMAGARFFLAGVIMYSAARFTGAPRPVGVTWKSALIVGACLLLGGNGAVTVSEKWVPSGLAALLIATIPIYIALFSWITGAAPHPKPMVWLGLAGGFLGVSLLMGPVSPFPPVNSSSKHLALGMSILLISPVIWSVGSLYARTAKNAPSPFLAAGQQMLCGGGLMILLGLLMREHRGFDLQQVSWLSLGAFVYLVIIGSLVGFPAYIFLLRHCDPSKVASYAYVNPIVAVLLGALFAHETLTLRTLVAAGLIIGSVALVITAQTIRVTLTSVSDSAGNRRSASTACAVANGEEIGDHSDTVQVTVT